MKRVVRTRALRYGVSLLLFSIAFVAIFPAVAAHPGSRLACCYSDSSGTIRDYVIASIEHKTPFTLTHDAYNGAPEGTPRTPATTLAAAGIQTAFVWELRGVFGLVGAWNLFLFLGLVGTAIAMFVLLDRLGCAFAPALLGAYVFAFGPYALEHAYAGHLGLIQNWALVLVVGAMIRLNRVRSFGSGAIAGATVALAFYNSAYEGLFAAVIALAFVLPELRRLPSKPERIRSLALLSSIYYSTLVFLSPILLLYSQERSAVQEGAGHGYVDIFELSASPLSYFVPSPRNPLFHWARSIHPSDVTEQTLFWGFTSWILAIVAVGLVRRRNTWLRNTDTRWWTAISMILLAVIAFILSLPPAYRPGGFPVFMPSVVLTGTTTYWRAYARFGVLVGLALATLAPLALTALSRRPGRGWRFLPALALVLVVAELLPGNVGALDTNKRPEWVSWLASHPRGIVADYPIAANLDAYTTAVADFWYQRLDGDPAFEVLGDKYYLLRTRNPTIRLLAEQVQSNLAVDILAAESVRYVVIHDDAYRLTGRRPPVPNSRLKLLARFGGTRIYSVPSPRTDIRTILRNHQLLIAKRQELRAPKVALAKGFGPLEHRSRSAQRRMARKAILEVELRHPRTANVVKELRLTGIASNDGPPLVLRIEDSHGHTLARQSIPQGTVELRTGPIAASSGGKFSLRLMTVPGANQRGTSSAFTPLFVSHLALAPLPDFAPALG